MDINSMRYFLAAAEYLNFTKAAEFCYITQTAMSVSIAKTEREIGATLFHRSNKRMALTEAGELFYQQISEIVRAYDSAVSSVHDVGHALSNQLTILFPYIAEANLFVPVVRRFREKHPEVPDCVK